MLTKIKKKIVIPNPTSGFQDVESNCQLLTVNSRQPFRGVMQFSLQILNM